MSYNIIQRGNEHTNSSDRDKRTPTVIVNHISAGSMESMDSWFRSSGNKKSSAHYAVAKDGRIYQYVDIRRMAWTQGLTVDRIAFATAPIIREHSRTNPNKYCIGIEHEGTDGELTEAQFAASVWLHKHIQAEVKRIYGHTIDLTPRYVIGHCQVDPKRKPFCPGPRFPWPRLYAALAKPETSPPKVSDAPKVVQILENGASIRSEEGTGLIFDGAAYARLTLLARIFGAQATSRWDNSEKAAYFNGRKIASAQVYEGRAYIPVRPIVESYGARVKWDGKGPVIDIIKEAKQ